MDQHRKSLTMGRSVGTQQQNEKLKSARSIGELSAIVETGRPSSANPTDNSAGKGNQLQVPGIKETPIKSAPSFAILDASSGEEDSLVAEQHDTQRKSIDGSNNSEKATNNRRLSSYYVTTSSGGIQPTAQFLESSEDQRFLARHFPDICTEPIQGSIGCALEREVLWHGRLVYTAKHLCFRGRLFAKAIKILVPFRDILAIEKKSTVLIPNGLRVVTLHSKHVFTSIIRRDTAYQQLHGTWKRELQHRAINKPGSTNSDEDGDNSLQQPDDNLASCSSSNDSEPSELNIGQSASSSSHPQDTGAAVNTVGEENLSITMMLSTADQQKLVQEGGVILDQDSTPVAGDETAAGDQTRQQKTSKQSTTKKKKQQQQQKYQQHFSLPRPTAATAAPTKEVKKSTSVSIFKNVVSKFGGGNSSRAASLEQLAPLPPKPASNRRNSKNSINNNTSETPQSPSLIMPLDPVKCGCETHLKHTVYNAVIDGVDVCQLFHLLFSVDGMHFMAAFQQSRGTENYQPTAWPQDSESGGRKLRDFTYNIVFKAPMSAASKTKCIERQEMKRETKFAYVVELHTKTPNVPYGDAFEVVTRYCLTFERPTATRMHVSTAVEFGRSVFWESMIEKGALDGTTAFSRDLATALVNRLKNGDRDALIGPVPSLLRPGRKRSSQTAISSPVGAISSPLQTFVDSANVQQSKTQRWSPLTLMEFLMSLSREQLVFGFFIFNMFLSAFTAYQYIRWNGRLRLISDRTGVSTEQLQLYLRYRSTTILDDNTIQPRSMEERWTETELLMDDLRSELSLQQKYFSSIASGKGGVKSNRRSANYDIVVC